MMEIRDLEQKLKGEAMYISKINFPKLALKDVTCAKQSCSRAQTLNGNPIAKLNANQRCLIAAMSLGSDQMM